MIKSEAETPVLYFGKMKYLISNNKFCEIEFLGHVFGFPTAEGSMKDFENHVDDSVLAKKEYFTNAVVISKLTDIDLTMKVLND